ncbi:MAG: Excinuclease ABC subunit A, partial [uncultured Gemmatimonadaceae bacterium]
ARRSPDRSRRTRAQSQERRRHDPARPPHGDHRALGVGEVVAGVRHHLRRGAAAVRGVALGLRAAVPRADGEARRRRDRGALAGDLDRAEDGGAQPALHRGHGHRDLRLPAAAVRARGHAALPQLRPRRAAAERRADRRRHPGVGGGDAARGAGAARARAEGRVPRAVREHPQAGVHPRGGRRGADRARRPAEAEQAAEPQRVGGRRPARRARRRPRAPRRLARDRAEARRRVGGGGRAPGRRRRRARDARVLGALRLPGVRHLAARARAAPLLLQLPVRRLRVVRRPRHAPDRERGADPRRPGPLDPRGGRAAVGRAGRVSQEDHPPPTRPRARVRPRRAVARPPRRGATGAAARDGERRGVASARRPGRGAGSAQGREGRRAGRVRPAVGGDPRHRAAPLRRDRLRERAGGARELHDRGAVPRVRGRAAQAGVARGHRERARHRVRGRHAGHRRAALLRDRAGARPRAPRRRPRDRRADPQGVPRAAPLSRRRRARLPDAQPLGGVALGRRGAAHPPRDADRLAARRRALHPRRAVDRAAPARQRAAAGDARAAPRPRQHRDRRGARRGDDADRRLPDRHGARRRQARRRGDRRGHLRRGGRAPRVRHRPVPPWRQGHPGPGPAARARREARDPHLRRARAQPAQRGRRRPARGVRGGHGRERLGEVDAHRRHPPPVARAALLPRARGAGRAHEHHGPRARGQGHRHRPEPDRPHAALEPRDVHRALHPDSRAVRRDAGGEDPRLRRGALLVQRQGRAVRGVPGRRPREDRDALPPRRVRAVRRVQGEAVQPRDARGALPRAERRGGARPHRRGRAGLLREPAAHRAEAADAQRRGPRLHPPGAERDHALGRGGAAHQARDGAEQARHRPHLLHPRRAHHRAPLRGRAAPARRAPPPRGPGEHRARDRAQPRRHQDGRLDRRSRPGRREGRRHDRRFGHAGGRRRGGRVAHRAVPPPAAPEAREGVHEEGRL